METDILNSSFSNLGNEELLAINGGSMIAYIIVGGIIVGLMVFQAGFKDGYASEKN